MSDMTHSYAHFVSYSSERIVCDDSAQHIVYDTSIIQRITHLRKEWSACMCAYIYIMYTFIMYVDIYIKHNIYLYI